MQDIQSQTLTDNVELPLLPLRDMVVYPHMVVPLFVGRRKSINALEAAVSNDKQIMLVAQKNASDDNPQEEDMYQIGTLSSILQLLKLPDGTVKVLVEGKQRAKINTITEDEYFRATILPLEIESSDETELEVLVRSAMDQFDKYVKLSKKIPSEVFTSLASIDDPGRLADTIAAHMPLKLDVKQSLLEMHQESQRLEHLMGLMESEIDLLEVERKIRGRIKKQMEKSQREYYLNEQMKAIQKELGESDETGNVAEELETKINEAGMPKEAKEKAISELKKLKMMSPMSAEATVLRNYIDWIVNVPWKKRSKVRSNLKKAAEILDADHYGLEEVKERILEYLVVQKRVKKLTGPVLCLVGPPGVGKTSLGQSIARATNRKFARMSLGGVRDESEIRGHRRTYIGSLPGKLLQKLSKAGVRNPLFLLDEIDKMGVDMRGDPASALLEVLDPEQNNKFNDHYLEVDYDLSDVMFICTSNSMNIPEPLLDRMEVIRIPGYIEDEKINIASRYLTPKQMKKNGLKQNELEIPDETVRELIRYYTREAGVRSLEREIAKICRKFVKETELEETVAAENKTITPDKLEHYCGVKRFKFGLAQEEDQIGHVTGLAWTQVGGELLSIEAVAVPGKGRQTKTGSLGDVMQESIQTALTVVRSRAKTLGISPDFHENLDIHIHVPEGATPKDGPSAGIGMCTAFVSVLTSIPVHADVAMTGEITLRGEVLKIGGLKEKLLAAHRGGIKKVIIPEDNQADLKEIPENIKADLDIKPVKWVDEVLQIALQHMPEPLADDVKVIEKEDTTVSKKPPQGQISTH